FLLEHRGDFTLLHPALPVAGRLVPEALEQRRQWLFHRRSPTQDQVLSSGKGERLAAEIRKRDVGGEAQLSSESLESKMMRAVHCCRTRLGPAELRFAHHDDTRRAFDWLNDTEQLRRPE